MVHRVKVLGGGLELDFAGQVVKPPTAPAEVGVLVVLALHPGRELAIGAFKIALFDVDPGLVSDSTIHTPISRLRRAGLPIPKRRYLLDLDPSEVDIIDADSRARGFIEAATNSDQLDPEAAYDLARRGDEIHRLWRHDPAEAVGHRPLLSQLFEPYRRRHRRFGMALARLLAATGETVRAFELLADYVDRYGDDATSSELRHQLRELISTQTRGPDAGETPVAAERPTGAAANEQLATTTATPADAIAWPVQIGHPPAQARSFQPRPR